METVNDTPEVWLVHNGLLCLEENGHIPLDHCPHITEQPVLDLIALIGIRKFSREQTYGRLKECLSSNQLTERDTLPGEKTCFSIQRKDTVRCLLKQADTAGDFLKQSLPARAHDNLVIGAACCIGLQRKAPDFSDAVAFNDYIAIRCNGREDSSICLCIKAAKQGCCSPVHEACRQTLVKRV